MLVSPCKSSNTCFEKSKTIPSTYVVKAQDISLEIDITTLEIIVTETSIKVVYLVNDSENKYEYYLARSD